MNTEDIKKEEEKLLSENLIEDDKKFPSLFVQTRNLMKQAWLSGTDLFKGKSLMSTPEKAAARWQICVTCDFLHQDRCLKCGCFMQKKIHLESSQCPLNKWGNLQVLIKTSQSTNAPVQSPIDMNIFPESTREKILQIATHAANNPSNNGSFYYESKRYSCNINSDGIVEIFDFIRRADENSSTGNKNIISHYSEEEKAEFNALVQQAKSAENKTFTYKGDDFVVKIEGGKTFVGLA
jgi:hypothetical protein